MITAITGSNGFLGKELVRTILKLLPFRTDFIRRLSKYVNDIAYSPPQHIDCIISNQSIDDMVLNYKDRVFS